MTFVLHVAYDGMNKRHFSEISDKMSQKQIVS